MTKYIHGNEQANELQRWPRNTDLVSPTERELLSSDTQMNFAFSPILALQTLEDLMLSPRPSGESAALGRGGVLCVEDLFSLTCSMGAQIPPNDRGMWLFPPLFPPPGRNE